MECRYLFPISCLCFLNFMPMFLSIPAYLFIKIRRRDNYSIALYRKQEEAKFQEGIE